MGLGKLLPQHRAIGTGGTRYEAYDMTSGAHLDTFKIFGDLAPDWPASAYKNGMSIPGGWRASLLISGLLSGMPWNAFRAPSGDDPSPRLVVPTPPLLQQPAPPDTRFTTMRSMALDYLWEGNAIGVYAARGRDGWPTAIVPVPAAFVGVRRVDERDYGLPVGEIEYSIGSLRFSPSEVLHVKGPCEPGGLRGLGILEAHMKTLRGADSLSAEAHSVKGVPTGYIKSTNPDLKQPQADALKAKWLETQAVRTVAVLNATTEFIPLAWNPEQAQLIEARKFSLTDMENIFGLPIGWLGGQTSSRTYSNIEQDAINLIKFSMNDHYTAFKETLSQAFPRGMTIEPDLDALLASDTLNRYIAYGHATGNKPWMLPSEVRAKERMRAVDDIDAAPAPAVPVQPDNSSNPEPEGIEQ